jgi:beta-fructofuranosidase
MHVVEANGKFEMYYTGLQRQDRGGISRIGFAESTDLLHWTKNQKNIYPIAPKGIYYETHELNPRKWISFRDPFKYEDNGDVYLLIAARTISGPVSRRGCVGVVKITNDEVLLMPPLLYPMVYDDIECPCAFELNKRCYLIGSIREDIKVRYWFAPEFLGEYHSFHDDVLLPQGNYAARIVQDGKHLLIYNFFYAQGQINSHRVLPPPKELETDSNGRLILKTFYRWEKMVSKTITQPFFEPAKPILGNPTGSFTHTDAKWTCAARSGYEIFLFEKPSACFIWEGTLVVDGMGKLGLVCDMDEYGNGYFISFDVSKGLTKIRTWGFNPLDSRENFIFKDLQAAIFPITEKWTFSFRLVRYGSYIELSIDGVVKLTLMDYTFSDKGIGLYSASSVISLQQSILKVLPNPKEEYVSPEEGQKII